MGGGGVVLLFRSENDELVQEAKKKKNQSCFPSHVSLIVFIADEDDSRS